MEDFITTPEVRFTKATLFNDVRAAMSRGMVKPGGVRKTVPAPSMFSPFSDLIAKAGSGTMDPRTIDAEISRHCGRVKLAVDANEGKTLDRLTKANDPTLNRLYAARRMASTMFRKNGAIAASERRKQAMAEMEIAEARIVASAKELRRHDGKLTAEQAYAAVLRDDPSLYSDYLAAKLRATP